MVSGRGHRDVGLYQPFKTSLLWHLGGLVVKGFGAIFKAVWEVIGR